MNRSIQRSLLAGLIAMAFAAGSFAAAPERDPGQQSPNTPANTQSQQSREMQNTAGAMSNDATGRAGTSLAQDKFAQLDVNTDGMIDKDEASASKALTAEFKRLDTNKDGKLSLTEFSAAKNLASIKVDNATKSNKSKKGY